MTDPKITIRFGPLGFTPQQIVAVQNALASHSLFSVSSGSPLKLCFSTVTVMLHYKRNILCFCLCHSDIYTPMHVSKLRVYSYLCFRSVFSGFVDAVFHHSVKAWATLCSRSDLWTSFKWKLYNYDPCETLPLWWRNWYFFCQKWFWVMQFLMLCFFSFFLSIRLLKDYFASKCTLPLTMAAIKLLIPWGPRQCFSNLFFKPTSHLLQSQAKPSWHNSHSTHHNHLPFICKYNSFLGLLHIVVHLPCWQSTPEMTATAGFAKALKINLMCCFLLKNTTQMSKHILFNVLFILFITSHTLTSLNKLVGMTIRWLHMQMRLLCISQPVFFPVVSTAARCLLQGFPYTPTG